LLGRLGAALEPEPTVTPTSPTTETATTETATTETVTPTVTPDELLDIVLPGSDIAAISAIGAAFNLSGGPLAPEHTVVYTLPGSGVAFMVTPPSAFAEGEEDRFIERPALLSNYLLAGLTVVQDSPLHLPAQAGEGPDHYVLRVSDDGSRVELLSRDTDPDTGLPEPVELIIRRMTVPLSRPTALITAGQICVNPTATVQACAQLASPPPPEVLNPLLDGISRLQEVFPEVNEADFALDRAVPDIEARNGIGPCMEALAKEPPDYAGCQPTVIIAPLVNPEGSFADDDGQARRIGLLRALRDLEVDAFADPELTNSTFRVFAGIYQVFEVRRDDDEFVRGNDNLRWTRTWHQGVADGQPGQVTIVYTPSLSGWRPVGRDVSGRTPEIDEAIIINGVIDGVVIFCGELVKWECSAVTE
jgi:hypothetical protein